MNIHSEVHAIVPSVEDGPLQIPMLREQGIISLDICWMCTPHKSNCMDTISVNHIVK